MCLLPETINLPIKHRFITVCFTTIFLVLIGFIDSVFFSPPGVPFVIGAPLGENGSSEWVMFIKLYNSEPSYNCLITFEDMDRKNIERLHYNSQYSLSKSDSQVEFSPTEIDSNRPAQIFRWSPLAPDSQHYQVNVTCRGKQFQEKWEVTRVDKILLTRITLEEVTFNPSEKHKRIYECVDKNFYETPLLEDKPQKPLAAPADPRWKPNHAFELPVAIIGMNSNIYVANSARSKAGCWNALYRHLGD